jgi:5-methylcytosine-specific restriction endonuclease McrA
VGGVKRCPKCGETKPIDAFGLRRRENGQMRPKPYCRPCWYLVQKEWRRRNPEKARAISGEAVKRWREKNGDRDRAARRAYYHANPERQRAASERWFAKNPEKRTEYMARRRARLASAVGHATAEQIAARVAFYGNRCWVCDGPNEAIDHVKPLHVGGSNWPANLRPICHACNASKGHQWPFHASTRKISA